MQILTEAFMLSPKQAKEKRTDPSKLPPSEARKLFTTTAHLKQDPPSREEENHHVTPKPITDRSGFVHVSSFPGLPLRGFSPIRTLRSQESTSPALRPPLTSRKAVTNSTFQRPQGSTANSPQPNNTCRSSGGRHTRRPIGQYFRSPCLDPLPHITPDATRVSSLTCSPHQQGTPLASCFHSLPHSILPPPKSVVTA
ncbi:hypothetical protein BLNAU_1640 [Blattamonas nauphoetae]|uniref:Uncharacterized protein n=1 Tax=Blattamonas nauphoetae TaxID=2049346 RepID=A0ABQ9YIN6_9EUKA|nr:hypothetical protein BLNAU_1640 [Blattamonas nauphoetae]